MDTAKRAVLKRGWLADQDHDFQKAILERAKLQEYPVGSRVFEVGDFRGGIYGVAAGAFAIKVQQRDGEDRLAHICRAGLWFGYDSLLSRRNRLLEYIAIEPSLALHVPLVALDQLAASDPTYHRYLARITAHGLDNAIVIVSDLLVPNVEKRIASMLLRIASHADEDPAGQRFISGLTQAQIGDLANAARDVVNRTLKRFEAKGWIEVSYRHITLHDPAALEALCSS